MSDSAAEKTEKATPKRRQKERNKGHISKTQDLIAALMVTVGIALLATFSSFFINKITGMMRFTFSELKPSYINNNDTFAIFAPYITVLIQTVVPFMIILMLIGILVVRVQIGHVFAVSKIKFDFNNIAPNKALKNLQKMLNPAEPRNLVEFVKSLLKLAIVFFCGFAALKGRFTEIISMLGQNLPAGFSVIGSVLTQMLINICIAMLVIGILDKKYQDYEYEKSIKMTKQEVKDEFKQSEGDVKVKSKIRSIQMKIARQRMFANVAEASVVVTNPTHYAVALKFDKVTNPTPIVVAKGVDFVAFKIRELAYANKVPVVENPPLARALYKLVPIDGIIPQEMFVAVAEVLAYVYSKNKKMEN